MKKITALMLALLLFAAVLPAGTAEETAAPARPTMKEATYTCQGSVPWVDMQYTDSENRTWIEVYLLKKGVVEPNMGEIEQDGETYSIVGIQTIDPNNPDQYIVLEDGTTRLVTDLYLGSGDPPQPGEEVFLTVGLTGSDGEEAVGELIPITVPELNGSVTGVPASAAESPADA